jgi:transposase
MTERRDSPAPPPADRIEAAVLEATRDLRAHLSRELTEQTAKMEERFERRIADLEAELRGVATKLVAIRNELHQSLRDQTLKLAITGISALALAIAVLLMATRLWP